MRNRLFVNVIVILKFYVMHCSAIQDMIQQQIIFNTATFEAESRSKRVTSILTH